MALDPAESAGEMVLYRTEDGRTHLEVKFQGETVWLTQAQIAELFQTTPQNITLHIGAIYQEGELLASATCKESLQVRQEGARQVRRQLKHYNLDVIIAVGYRVRSHRGTQFRIWATERLKEYMLKGHAARVHATHLCPACALHHASPPVAMQSNLQHPDLSRPPSFG